MVQVKKESVRLAILDAAFRQFSEVGYNRTTLQDIATGANTGVGSIYSYFDSKLQILYEVFEPWQDARYLELEARVAGLAGPREKLRAILLGIWRDIPMSNIMLANSLMEALSSTDIASGKPGPLLAKTEARLGRMLTAAIEGNARPGVDLSVLPNLILMAYDGFVINRRLNDVSDLEALTDTFCSLLLASPQDRDPSDGGRPE